MSQYLLSIFQPPGEMPDEAALTEIMRQVEELNDELRAAGAWVFGNGLELKLRPKRGRGAFPPTLKTFKSYSY